MVWFHKQDLRFNMGMDYEKIKQMTCYWYEPPALHPKGTVQLQNLFLLLFLSLLLKEGQHIYGVFFVA